jgi:hypothetical protein
MKALRAGLLLIRKEDGVTALEYAFIASLLTPKLRSHGWGFLVNIPMRARIQSRAIVQSLPPSLRLCLTGPISTDDGYRCGSCTRLPSNGITCAFESAILGRFVGDDHAAFIP